MFVLATLLICLITLIIVYLWTIKSRYSYFEQRGIPCPPFRFFFGHSKTIWSTPRKTDQLQKWTRQFGSIYGLYKGSRPVYIVSDADFLQEVFTKQFSSFHSRHLPFVLREKAEETVAYDFDKNLLVRLSQLMPWLIPLLTYVMTRQILLQRFANKFIRSIEEIPRFWLIERLKYLIDVRTSSSDKEGKNRRVDLLQLMLDVATRNEIMDHTDVAVMSKFLHYDEVSHNMLTFMVAGYETTATTLGYSTYILAKEPLVQKKLQDELDNYDENKNEYDQVHSMIYLDWFIREVLRMFPAAPQVTTRECNRTTVVCGHTIDEGSVIQADVLSVHYNPDLWGPEDPNIFLPERHSTPRHPAAYLPFGIGPRNCIGKRFALMETKLCLARLLRQYSIYPSDQMEEKFELEDTSFILHPKSVYVKIVKRS
ncbi:unnamed protein product [Rotaria sordida]|uniref:Cytochrome P450 n=1 Tax=Rotaria sordida TaxID=392033 RepID=A0A815HDS3_9BILA|nr:unnamed protein product [Rotaria sordida]CAF3723768.1 unnamed protein product [Rotaria sordida]CAF4150245.1 unnamed protein product [Rotaria sordida]